MQLAFQFLTKCSVGLSSRPQLTQQFHSDLGKSGIYEHFVLCHIDMLALFLNLNMVPAYFCYMNGEGMISETYHISNLLVFFIFVQNVLTC